MRLFLFFKFKAILKDHVSYDKHVLFKGRDFLVHYNYYFNCLELKNTKYDILGSLNLRLFDFLTCDKEYIKILKLAY
jgi:hypothetical protein